MKRQFTYIESIIFDDFNCINYKDVNGYSGTSICYGFHIYIKNKEYKKIDIQ